jgi:hypothetical protein
MSILSYLTRDDFITHAPQDSELYALLDLDNPDSYSAEAIIAASNYILLR